METTVTNMPAVAQVTGNQRVRGRKPSVMELIRAYTTKTSPKANVNIGSRLSVSDLDGGIGLLQALRKTAIEAEAVEAQRLADEAVANAAAARAAANAPVTVESPVVA